MTTEYYVIHDDEGRILESGWGPEGQIDLVRRGGPLRGTLLAVDRDPIGGQYWIQNGALVDRPDLPAFDKTTIVADGVDAATVAGLPAGCRIRIDEVEHAIIGDALALTSVMPADYIVEIECWPYRDGRHVIVAL